MLAVTGIRTSIVQEYLALTGEAAFRIDADLSRPGVRIELPDADRFLLAAGVLHGKPIGELTPEQFEECVQVNLVNTIRICEQVLRQFPKARICVIGSESAYNGSYDLAYAVTKAALHRYVELRSVGTEQTLALVSPPIIVDSGMTLRRSDYAEVLARRRTVRAEEVAERVLSAFEREPGESFVDRMC